MSDAEHIFQLWMCKDLEEQLSPMLQIGSIKDIESSHMIRQLFWILSIANLASKGRQESTHLGNQQLSSLAWTGFVARFDLDSNVLHTWSEQDLTATVHPRQNCIEF